MAKKRLTPNQKRYYKNVERIQRQIESLNQQGVDLVDYEIPTKPKRITKAWLRDFEKIDPIKNAYVVDPSTGELIPYSDLQAQTSPRIGSDYDESVTYPKAEIIEAIEGGIERLPDVKYYGYKIARDYSTSKYTLLNLLDGWLDRYETYDDYVKYLKSVEEQIFDLFDVVLYDSNEYNTEQSFNRLFELIKGNDLTFNESEEIETLNNEMENFENV